MITKGKKFFLAAGALACILGGVAPAMAQHSGGGGHSSGGHMGGGHAVAGGHAGGAHFAGGTHFAGGAHFAPGFHGSPAGFHGGGFAGHPGFNGHFVGHGFSSGVFWHGGFWHGGFWPRAFYGPGFAWFLPILPLAYATYWWGGVPYYYANDVYYTYDPSYQGYVATDPPPVSGGDSSGDSSGSAVAPNGAPAGAPSSDPAQQGVVGQIFMYPKNGQSVEQQATDKAECQQWATQQAGQVAQNSSDYQRAMVACVEGRGYSAR